jgi:intracellular septation protein
MPKTNFLISLAIEFSSVLAFFLFSVWYGFFAGVQALIVFVILSLIISLIRDKRIPLFMIINSSFTLLFGVLALYFKDPYFIVIELSLYNLFLGLIMCAGFIKNKPAMKYLFGTMFAMTERGWRILSVRWGVMFFIMTATNEIVWRMLGEGAWIYFRLGLIFILGIFGFYQFTLAKRERLPEASAWGLKVYTKI